MLKELTSSELHLAETEETASSYSQSIKKLTYKLESERRRADDLTDELKRAKARMTAAEAAAATPGAYYGAGDDEAANAEKWAELLAGLNKLDGSITFDQLIEQVYGVPISGKDGSTDSLEWRFLRALPKLK